MDSLDDMSDLFNLESGKLYAMINGASKSEISIPKIIELYYQVTNVSSMITMLQQFDGIDKPLLLKIAETKTIISEKFDSALHPKILEYLSQQVENSMKFLQSNASGKKIKEEIEKEAQIYENLRKEMSTKEFVEQYDKGLK